MWQRRLRDSLMSYLGTWWRSGDGNKRDVTTGCYLVSLPTPAHSSDLPVWGPAERRVRGGTPGRKGAGGEVGTARRHCHGHLAMNGPRTLSRPGFVILTNFALAEVNRDVAACYGRLPEDQFWPTQKHLPT